jgi:hypothetical protein
MENKMSKQYALYGIDTAINLLRPGSVWEIYNWEFTKWNDPRPQPTKEEIIETMEKIKKFEDSIDTIWLPEQLEILKDIRKDFQ